MDWKQARLKAMRIGCKHAIAATLKAGSGKRPRHDTPATVVCKEKIRQGYRDDVCDENCPPGVNR